MLPPRCPAVVHSPKARPCSIPPVRPRGEQRRRSEHQLPVPSSSTFLFVCALRKLLTVGFEASHPLCCCLNVVVTEDKEGRMNKNKISISDVWKRHDIRIFPLILVFLRAFLFVFWHHGVGGEGVWSAGWIIPGHRERHEGNTHANQDRQG